MKRWPLYKATTMSQHPPPPPPTITIYGHRLGLTSPHGGQAIYIDSPPAPPLLQVLDLVLPYTAYTTYKKMYNNLKHWKKINVKEKWQTSQI